MYKIEGEDLYLIGTSEHTMIGRFIDQTLDEATLPLTLTSYPAPGFRKENGRSPASRSAALPASISSRSRNDRGLPPRRER